MEQSYVVMTQLYTTEFMRLSMPPGPDSCIGIILYPREWMRMRELIEIEINLN